VLTDETVQGDSAPRPVQLPDSVPRPDTALRRPTP